jgi:hypothetical protein
MQECCDIAQETLSSISPNVQCFFALDHGYLTFGVALMPSHSTRDGGSIFADGAQ